MTTSRRFEPPRPRPAEPSPPDSGPDPAAAGTVRDDAHQGPGRDDSDLLAALLDGMDAALFALDADGTVTHWNREAARILGWSAAEAVGRRGLGGWATRAADAPDVETRLMAAMEGAGRQVHEFALRTRDGGRVLVRTQSSPVRRPGGRPSGVYCAFSEVHAQIDLERSIALSEALLDDATWGVVVVDADLRPAVVNSHAARALRAGRSALLGRPLGEVVADGVDVLENALQHVLAEGTPPAPTELWVTLRRAEDTGRDPAAGGGRRGAGADPGGARREGRGAGFGASDAAAAAGDGARAEAGAERRCWRSGFLRLASPLAEEPVPLGVAWLFLDVTETKRAEQESSRLRFRSTQLHRAARAAAECEDPVEAATVQLDFALAGFADHALIDLVLEPSGAGQPPLAEMPPYEPRLPDAADAPYRPGSAGPHPAPHPPHASPPPLTGAADALAAARADLGSYALQPHRGPHQYDALAPLYPPPVRIRLVRAAATPAGASGPVPGPCGPVFSGGIPVPYPDGHPALQAAERCGSVRASSARLEGAAAAQWAQARTWPEGTVHGLCSVLRSRGRTLGVATFLRGASRRPFDRADAAYAEDVSVRVAAALDLARQLR